MMGKPSSFETRTLQMKRLSNINFLAWGLRFMNLATLFPMSPTAVSGKSYDDERVQKLN